MGKVRYWLQTDQDVKKCVSDSNEDVRSSLAIQVFCVLFCRSLVLNLIKVLYRRLCLEVSRHGLRLMKNERLCDWLSRMSAQCKWSGARRVLLRFSGCRFNCRCFSNAFWCYNLGNCASSVRSATERSDRMSNTMVGLGITFNWWAWRQCFECFSTGNRTMTVFITKPLQHRYNCIRFVQAS